MRFLCREVLAVQASFRVAQTPRSTSISSPRCRHCIHAASVRGFTSASRQSSNLPITERVRRKIWGTDQPPGRIDPYDPNSPLREEVASESQAKAGAEAGAVAQAEGEQEPSPEHELLARRLGKTGRILEATSVTDLTSADGYKPATTWEGLEWVGGKSWTQVHKEPMERWQGFIPEDKITSEEGIARSLHKALVEVFTFQQSDGPATLPWKALASQVNDPTIGVQIGLSPDGQAVQITYPSTEVRDIILNSAMEHATSADDGDANEDVVESEEADAEMSEIQGTSADPQLDDGYTDASSADLEALNSGEVAETDGSDLEAPTPAVPSPPYHKMRGWKAVPLEDPELKFAVIKRVMQLTGIRIPDPIIDECKTAGALFHQLKAKPKPKKLADSLKVNRALTSLPNVTLSERRVTSIDKDRAVGRWKVIEEALLERDLPMSGRG